MRKYFLFFLIAAGLFGDDPRGWISLKPSYFYPQDNLFRHLYGDGFLCSAELGYMLGNRCFFTLESGYFHKAETLASFDLKFSSSVTVVPSSLYLGSIIAQGNFWDLYVKAGPNIVYARTHVEIPNLPTNVRKWYVGGSFGCGSKFYFYKGFFLDLFFNYLYDRKKIKASGDRFFVYVGGFQTGGAIGYRF